ncbi:hypothetical protein AVEN_173755-1 [Araneus ventricosus]|uniref:Uncharacterized protein n=1 Tax=Araneus ventricosus TaxID=182803 RepID=A0A4Y2QIA4_ARAVE|nr:hypothetical protein AVEN_173755-1 [Araneus ventricosus]
MKGCNRLLYLLERGVSFSVSCAKNSLPTSNNHCWAIGSSVNSTYGTQPLRNSRCSTIILCTLPFEISSSFAISSSECVHSREQHLSICRSWRSSVAVSVVSIGTVQLPIPRQPLFDDFTPERGVRQ